MASQNGPFQSRIRSLILYKVGIRTSTKNFTHSETRSKLDFKIPVISLEWIDERFQWNPGQYAAVESIRVQGKDIWFPSIKDLLIFA